MLVIVLYIIVPLLCLVGTKIEINQGDVLTKDQTLIMRGLGMVFIIFTHMVETNICTSTYFFHVSGVIGVAVCFLVSGYGLHTSFKRKNNYLENFWNGKILRLLLPYIAAFILDLILAKFEGSSLYIKDICGNLLTVTIPGVTFWYLKIQFLLYIFFYFSYRIFSNMRNKIVGVTFFTIVYIVIAKLYGLDLFWYNSCLCFVWGIILAEYQSKILPLLRNNSLLIVMGGGFTLLYLILYFFGRLQIDWIFDMVYMTLFCGIVLCLVQKINGSLILKLLGYYSIEVYLIHTVIGGYFDSTNPLSYILVPLVSVIIGIPIHQISKRLISLNKKQYHIKEA